MTPFDTALRIKRREIDQIRIAISVAVERLTSVERDRDEADAAQIRERAVASEIAVPADAWVARMRARRAQLADGIRIADARLAKLRAEARDAYGTMRAIESAADRHREEADRGAAAAETARIDEIAATRHFQKRKLRRIA